MDHEQHEMVEKRETANADTHYVISYLAMDIASNRVAEDILLKKSTMLPQVKYVAIRIKNPVYIRIP